jgi:hypothetical protein
MSMIKHKFWSLDWVDAGDSPWCFGIGVAGSHGYRPVHIVVSVWRFVVALGLGRGDDYDSMAS